MRFLGWASNSEYSQGINLDGNFIPQRKNEKHYAHFSQIASKDEQFTGTWAVNVMVSLLVFYIQAPHTSLTSAQRGSFQ